MSASGEAQRRLEIWESEEPETPVTVGRFLDAQVSSSRLSRSVHCSWPRPARPPAGARLGRLKTWNSENLKTCRAPQPRRFPGFQISRLPLPRPARPRRSPTLRGPPLSSVVTCATRPWGWPCPAPERPAGAHSRATAGRRGARACGADSTATRCSTRFLKSDGRSISRPRGARWSAGDAGNPLRFKKVGVVARGGIEPPTRGFSVPGRVLKL
jgi:hypothetical protein